jgi:hypothetical protein
MLSTIFLSGLAIAALFIDHFTEHRLFNRKIEKVVVFASERSKYYRSRW